MVKTLHLKISTKLLKKKKTTIKLHNTLMKNNIKNFFHNYSLIFLGFLLFTLYFWNRFFRSQTSKDLPLNLSILHFFILVYVCLIFSYIVYSLLFPRKSNDLVEKFIEFLFTPIAEFDKYLKSLFSSQYKQFMKYIIPFMDFYVWYL